MFIDRLTSALVIAAHPDDEVLGCGGTMARLTTAGVTVNVAFVADGVGARGDATAGLADRRAAADRANRVLGAGVVDYGQLPDNQLDTVPMLTITRTIEAWVSRFRPQLVLTHHAGDLNVDHRRVHEAVLTACRPQPGHPVSAILAFEVASSTEWQSPGAAPPFTPNWFVDISAHLDTKLSALEAYAMEMRPWPHSRSHDAVTHLARWRGATAGVAAAEAFMLARVVEVW